jgi:single-strand DNA-binding protein
MANDKVTKGPIVTKVGNLTRDPEIKFGQSGKAYTRFGLAVDAPTKPGDWSGPRTTTFYEVTCFDNLAKNVADCLVKGNRVIVEGRADLRDWQDKDGNDRQTKGILANSVGAELSWATVAITRNPKSEEGPLVEVEEEMADF